MIPSTSLSISNCSTASATARRKSPSPAFSSKSASTNLSSVIGSSRVLQVEVWQLHLSRPGPMATSTTPQPYTADRPENSTTSVDANDGRFREYQEQLIPKTDCCIDRVPGLGPYGQIMGCEPASNAPVLQIRMET